MTDSAMPRERTIGGYTLLDKLNSGFVADTYLAVKRWLGGLERTCVIKVVHEDVALEEGFAEAFEAEARLALGLGHANVVTVTDLGCDAGRWFVVLERVEGRNLAQLTERIWQGHRPPPVAACVEIALQLLDGLEHCHERADEQRVLPGVHREIKPSNVLIGFDGTVKLGDFGLALSPSRLRRTPSDSRDDLFCVGALLYALLTGERFSARSEPNELISRLRERSQPGLWPISEELEEILLGVLSFGSARRFGSARELREALAAALAKIAPGYDRHRLAELMGELFDEQGERRQVRSFIAGATEIAPVPPAVRPRAIRPTPPPSRRLPPAKLPPPLPPARWSKGSSFDRVLAKAETEVVGRANKRRAFGDLGDLDASALPTVIGERASGPAARRKRSFGPPTLVTGFMSPVEDADVIEVIAIDPADADQDEGPVRQLASTVYVMNGGELRKVCVSD